MKRTLNRIILAIAFLSALLLSGCNDVNEIISINSLEELKDLEARIGHADSLDVDSIVYELCPKAQVSYLSSQEALNAFNGGKLDAYIEDDTVCDYMIEASKGTIQRVGEPIITYDVAFAISEDSKIPDLENKVNAFVDDNMDLMRDIYARWQSGENNEEMYEIPHVQNPEYELVVGTVGFNKPFCYYKNNTLSGADIEIAYHLAAYLNAEVRFEDADYNGILIGINTGMYDILAANLYYTPERAESITYSKPYYSKDVYMVAKNGASASGEDFISGAKTSFRKTFINENRYKMILSGIGVTLIITVFGFVLACILGAFICAMSMSKIKILNIISNAYSKIMQGTPMVVVLMIMYYLIFGKTNVSGVVVAILGFGISTSAYIAQIYRGSIEQVNKGEIEAAWALGFSKSATFMGIIMPQAIRAMLPSLAGQMVGLMKGTAIVGYIAVLDLTKVGDLIRSSTYEAFFPLLSSAAIYFIMSTIILFIMDRVIYNLDPVNKKREVKGVR